MFSLQLLFVFIPCLSDKSESIKTISSHSDTMQYFVQYFRYESHSPMKLKTLHYIMLSHDLLVLQSHYDQQRVVKTTLHTILMSFKKQRFSSNPHHTNSKYFLQAPWIIPLCRELQFTCEIPVTAAQKQNVRKTRQQIRVNLDNLWNNFYSLFTARSVDYLQYLRLCLERQSVCFSTINRNKIPLAFIV